MRSFAKKCVFEAFKKSKDESKKGKEETIKLFKDAISFFNKAIQIRDSYSMIYFERAEVYFYLKDYENSINDLKIALSLDNFPHYHVLYCKNLVAQKKFQEALDQCNLKILSKINFFK